MSDDALPEYDPNNYCEHCGDVLVDGDEIDYDAGGNKFAVPNFVCFKCGVSYGATHDRDTGMWYPIYDENKEVAA